MRGPRLHLLLAGLVLAAVVLTLLDARRSGSPPLDALRRGTDRVLGPVVRGVGGAAGTAGDALGDLPRIGRYREENERLRRENDELRSRLLEQESLEATRRQLAELLRLKERGSYETVPARVVGFGSTSPFAETVVLDVGSDDGVRVDQAVTSGRGLVGRTVRVGPTTTTVALVTDPGVSVGARLSRAPRSFGLLQGTGRAEDGAGMQLRLVEGAGEQVRVGDALVTAGSEAFEPGVPVGRVTAVEPPAGGRTGTATVEPLADLAELDLLQVITEGPRTLPRAAARAAVPR